MAGEKTKIKCRKGRAETPPVKSSISKIRSRNQSGECVAGKQDPTQPLSEKQRRYVNARIHEGFTPAAAARVAGYKDSDSEAYALERNPKILQAMAQEREKYAVVSGISRKQVIEGMMEAINMAKLQSEPMVMVTGWREIGKICGHYEPQKTKLEISVNGNVMLHKLEQLTDQQLLEQLTPAIEGDYEVVNG